MLVSFSAHMSNTNFQTEYLVFLLPCNLLFSSIFSNCSCKCCGLDCVFVLELLNLSQHTVKLERMDEAVTMTVISLFVFHQGVMQSWEALLGCLT